MQDGVVKEAPTMEILTGRKMMTSEGLREMAIMEDHQMIMIQMMATTMRAVEMMIPQIVVVTHYQAAVTPNAH